MKKLILVLLLVSCGACAKNAPPTLTPIGIKAYQANKVAIGLSALQRAAIQLHDVQKCDPLPCRPLISEDDTRIVLMATGDALRVLRAYPDGWQAVGLEALQRIESRLNANGQIQLAMYIQMAHAVLGAIE